MSSFAAALRDDDLDIFFDLLEEETGEDYHATFNVLCATGQRNGQAFFNCLPKQYQDQLQGSAWDPFYATSWGAVFKAIDFLTKG